MNNACKHAFTGVSRLLFIPIRLGTSESWTQFLIARHPTDKILVCANAGVAIAASGTAELQTVASRMTFVVTSANRADSFNYMLKASTTASNALVCGTTCLSTGVTLPGFSVGILANCSSTDDLVQRAGRLARQPGVEGVVYVLYSSQEVGKLPSHAKEPLRKLLSTTTCINVSMAHCFLLGDNPAVRTCLENPALAGLHCSVCDPEQVAVLRKQHQDCDGGDYFDVWANSIEMVPDDDDSGVADKSSSHAAEHARVDLALLGTLDQLRQSGQLPADIEAAWPSVRKSLNSAS
jgi:hypothetical protein